MRISLERVRSSCCGLLLRNENGASRLLRDTDFTPVARSFGWPGPTDEKSEEATWDAYEFLENAVGAVIDDPGYF